MRRTVLSGVVAVILLLAACAEQPTEPPSQPQLPEPSELIGGPPGCTLNNLLDLTKAILPPSPQLNTIVALLKALPVQPPPRLLAALRRSVFGIIDLVSRAHKAGRLKDSPDTPANVLAFIQGMYCFAGMPAPTFSTPTGPIDPDEFAFTVLTSTSGPVTLLPNSKQGGLGFEGMTLPPGVPFVTVTLFRLPDSPGPLFTSLDQYPLFYEFSVSPEVEFAKFVIGAVCLGDDDFPLNSSLRLAHNVGDNWGDVEILPFVEPTFLDCSKLPLTFPGPTGSLRGMRGLFASFFLPTRLHASNSALVNTTGVGGALKRLSPFGSVDPNSNPADLDFNGEFGELSAPAGTAVTPAPSVVVRSMNGTPIANVPVDFSVGEGGGTVNGGSTATVTTGDDGVATVDSWVLGEETGTYTLEATPRHVDQDPAPGEGLPNPPYRPAAEFDPASLTFTATATSGTAASIASFAGNGQSASAGTDVSIPPAVVVRDAFGNPVPGISVIFALISEDGAITGATPVTNADGVAAVGSWTLAVGTNTLAASVAGLSGSPVTFTATGEAVETTTLIKSDDPDPSFVGEGITVSVLVTGRNEVKVWRPRGTVLITDGNGASCTATLSLEVVPKGGGTVGECVLTPLTVGRLALTAAYLRDGEFNGSSDTEEHTVVIAPPITFGSDPTWSGSQNVCLNPRIPTNCPVGATVYTSGTTGWGADLSSIPGAFWIWSAGVTPETSPAYPKEVSFSKSFTLLGSQLHGSISVAADDYALVAVNGELVGAIGSTTDGTLAGRAQNPLTTFDLGPFLVAGTNTITVRGANGNFGCGAGAYNCNPAGVVFGGWLGRAP